MTAGYRHMAWNSSSARTKDEAEAIASNECARWYTSCVPSCSRSGSTWECSYYGVDADYTRTVEAFTEAEARAEVCPGGAVSCTVHACEVVGRPRERSHQPEGASCERSDQCEGALECKAGVCKSSAPTTKVGDECTNSCGFGLVCREHRCRN
jgi:hypothetical protein